MNNKLLLTLPETAERLGLPVAFLRREAAAGNIPHIAAGRRRWFDPERVLAALEKRAPRAKREGVRHGE